MMHYIRNVEYTHKSSKVNIYIETANTWWQRMKA